MIKVVNFMAGPGAGKSTLAAGVFNLMKQKGHKVELVTEYAKDLTYEKAFDKRNNQLVVLAEQDHRLRRLVGTGVEWVINDGPLPLCLAYASDEYQPWIADAIWGAWDRYDNYTIFVERSEDHPFQTYGRDQTLTEAMVLDNLISNIFGHIEDGDPDYAYKVRSDHEAPYKVYEWLLDGEGELAI